MQDWSKMQGKWQRIRDDKKVPKGAGGSGLSIGDAANKVGEAQKKGLRPFIVELTKFEDKLKKYKTAMQAAVQKYQKEKKDAEKKKYESLNSWITDNIEKWAKEDKKDAADEIAMLKKNWNAAMLRQPSVLTSFLAQVCVDSAKAQKISDDDRAGRKHPVAPGDVAKIDEVFDTLVEVLSNVGKVCTKLEEIYATSSEAAATKLKADSKALKDKTEELKKEVAGVSKHPNWYEVFFDFKGLESLMQDFYMVQVTPVSKAIEARIGT